MTSQIITQQVSAADLDDLPLIADIQFNEPMGSAALNRKFYGIMPAGIYRGFQPVVRGGLKVSVGDSPVNVAVVDVDGYMITVQGRKPIELVVPTGRKVYCIIEANYAVGRKTTQVDINASIKAADIRIINVNELRDNHVIVFSANLPADTTEIRVDQLDLEDRQDSNIGNDIIFSHTENRLNPHEVTKAQVGLNLVENYGIATFEEAQAGDVQSKYMTPALTRAAITEQAGAAVSSHTGDKNNPHGVTKAQVGLGNVQNYGVATAEEAAAGNVTNKLMTPATTAAAITQQAGDAVSSHTGNKNNPHGVTKAQVGLGNVNDWGATSATNDASDAKYATAGAVKKAYDLANGKAPASHEHLKIECADVRNVKPKDVPNGSIVPYFRFSTVDGGAYMDFIALNSYGDHTGGNINAIAAHKGTGVLYHHTAAHGADDWGVAYAIYSERYKPSKSDVGLGSVENYGVASAAEAQAGTATNKYMTPALTKAAITQQAGDAVSSHTGDKNNPHGVTKAQVGLGSVENYGVASAAEAQAGTATNKYMTPATTAAAITQQAGDAVSSHTGDKNNPHGVTKAQVGLGSVNDWPATSATNDASDAKYATAGAVKKAYDLANGKAPASHGHDYLPLSGGTLSGDLVINVSGGRRHIQFTHGGSAGTTYVYGDPNEKALKISSLIYCDGNGNFNDVLIRSDRRLKTNLVKAENALDKVSKLNAYHYDKKLSLEATEYTEKEFGLIAQELEAVLPDAVKTNEQTTLKTISNSAVNALLVEAIKELRSENIALKARLDQAGV